MIFGPRVEGCTARPIKSDCMAICEEEEVGQAGGGEGEVGQAGQLDGQGYWPVLGEEGPVPD